MERQQRQAELFSSLKGQISYLNAATSFPMESIFRPQHNSNPPDKQDILALGVQLKLLGDGVGRFQPKIEHNYARDGSIIEGALKPGQQYSSISVDINKLRQDLRDYFSS